ncbi:hypothetical protein SAMN05444004_11252 [Jannaschia faecimaris]|uniref:Uncharacterized protein n=1 Tax=Jannaschia faecimaris TaxID=1244108 RepID=A0A1H3SIS8_9RHOB|nr:hypothetical protein [Jannaschia faecimaris]SDZ37872.1 hypothetical protein SAMN05444004_11252 [Jannaschia faecimaris]
MSAPDTNLEKQAKNHFGPIIGIAAGVVFVGILLIAYLFFIVSPEENMSTGAAVQTDGDVTITESAAATE